MQDSAGATLYTLDPCVKVAAAGQGASSISFTPTLALPFTDVQAAIEGAAASAASGFTPFGLGVTGSVALVANIDATNIASGQYRFDATTTGTYPTGVAAADTGAIMMVRETSGSAWMWLYHDTTDRVFIRRMTSSTWGSWRENITANIGAVEGDILYRTATAWTRLPKGTAAQVLQMNAGATAPEWATATALTFLAPVNTTSGATVDLSTAIPSTARRITITLAGVSTNGTASLLVQVGNGSFVTTGYGSGVTLGGGNGSSTAGFIITQASTAASLHSGTVTLVKVSGNTWAASGSIGTAGLYAQVSGGTVTLGGALDRIRLTTAAADTYDAGVAVVTWE
jgi:hypothetical protein